MKSQKKFGLDFGTIERIVTVFDKHAIQKVILYGSRAMGNFRNGSDIDITIFAPKLETSDLLQIQNDLDELMLPYKIDLSLFHQIENESLLEHIKRVGVPFAV